MDVDPIPEVTNAFFSCCVQVAVYLSVPSQSPEAVGGESETLSVERNNAEGNVHQSGLAALIQHRHTLGPWATTAASSITLKWPSDARQANSTTH